jgi:hypothetical protein
MKRVKQTTNHERAQFFDGRCRKAADRTVKCAALRAIRSLSADIKCVLAQHSTFVFSYNSTQPLQLSPQVDVLTAIQLIE